MSRNDNLALARAARQQHGLLLASDLDSVRGRSGAWRRALRSGQVQQVLPGVLAPSGLVITPALLASAAMLWEPTALLSHHEAAAREGIWTPQSDHLRVVVPFDSTRRSLARLKVVRTRVLPELIRTDGFHRWTPASRTVVDLASLLTRRQLEAVLLSAVRQGTTSPSDVEVEADRVRCRSTLGELRDLLLLWRPERESFLEDVLFADVAAVTREEVVRQHTLTARSGVVVARVDVAIPALRLAFEADGLAFHSTDEQIAADQQRDRNVLAMGWPTMRFREGVLDHRRRVRADIARVIDRRRRDLRVA